MQKAFLVQAIQKQAADQIWSLGHPLPTPALFYSLYCPKETLYEQGGMNRQCTAAAFAKEKKNERQPKFSTE